MPPNRPFLTLNKASLKLYQQAFQVIDQTNSYKILKNRPKGPQISAGLKERILFICFQVYERVIPRAGSLR